MSQQPIPTAGPPGGTDRKFPPCPMNHQPGEHDKSCCPPADPANPEVRLLRAIYGLCPDCDETEAHEHDTNFPPADDSENTGLDDPSWSDQAAEDEFIESARDYLRGEEPF